MGTGSITQTIGKNTTRMETKDTALEAGVKKPEYTVRWRVEILGSRSSVRLFSSSVRRHERPRLWGLETMIVNFCQDFF